MRTLQILVCLGALAGAGDGLADSQCTFAPDCAPGGYTPPYEAVTETPVSVVACQAVGGRTTITTPTFGPYSVSAECPGRCGRRQSYDCSYTVPCNCDDAGENCQTCVVDRTCSRCVRYTVRLACRAPLRLVYQGVCGGGNWVWSRSSAQVGTWSYTCPTSC